MQFNDLGMQYRNNREKIDQAVQKVFEDGCFILGKPVELLEERLAKYVGQKYCITCANGTDALTMALVAMGIKKGDAVFTTAFSFFATVESIVLAGGTPVFVDADEASFNMDTTKLCEAVKKVKAEGTLNPKAILPVDLYGLPADYDAITDIAKEYGLLVLEDGAQGFGGSIRGKKACSFGDVSTTSFFPAKPLGCYGDGGAIFTDNPDVAKLVVSLRHHGKGEEKYDNIRFGFNSRLDTVQAAVLHCKLDIFDEEIIKRQKAAKEYTSLLKCDTITPKVPKYYQSAWSQYTLRAKNAKHRKVIMNFLSSHGIPAMIYYKTPLHMQKAFNQKYKEYDFPVSSMLSQCVFSLPMHPYLTLEEIKFVCEKLNEIY